MADDFSDDGTWEWMKEIAEKDHNVKIHRNDGPTRLGHTILYDTLVNMATNDIVMIYHADMYALPGLDERSIKTHQTRCGCEWNKNRTTTTSRGGRESHNGLRYRARRI